MASELSIADIDRHITIAQNSLSQFPRSHLSHTLDVHVLAMARSARYSLSQQKKDLDRAIVHRTEAILLPPITQPGPFLNIVDLLYRLAENLLVRSEKFEQPEDVKYSIKYLRYLRGLSLESFGVPRNKVTALLVHALAVSVEFGIDDGTRNIEDMVVLCRELLASDISADIPVGAFISLDQAVDAEFNRGWPIHLQLLDKVIECLRDAAMVCPPDSYNVLLALASQIATRFTQTHLNDDYEDATALLDKILDPNQPQECPEPIRVRASSFATVLVFARSAIFKKPEDGEVAMSRLRASLNSSSLDENFRFLFVDALVKFTKERSRDYNLAESHEEANSFLSQILDMSSSRMQGMPWDYIAESAAVREAYSMTVIRNRIHFLEELHPNTAPGSKHYTGLLSGLADWYQTKFSRTGDISDIEESFKYSRLLLDAAPTDSMRAPSLISMRNSFLLAFERTNETNYLDESIILGYEILKFKGARHYDFQAIQQLVSTLITRSRLLSQKEDLHEAIRLMSLAVDDQFVREPNRFRLSCEWAIHARSINHPTTLTAYKSAMSSMQKALSSAPTVSTQHIRLVAMGENCQTMPLDYASYQIHLGRFEEAVEALEQGRALLWSEMRGLRTPMAQLIREDPSLAKKLSEINLELEALTVSITPSAMPEMEASAAQGEEWTDPFGRLVVRQRKLVEERDALISEIQGRPGLEGFLKTPSFAALRSAASRGPVIIINHCKWRSDILIIFRNSLPCAISTADEFYDRANKLRDELVKARRCGLDSVEFQDALCSVLKKLYELVGEPVIRRLRMLGVPEQSRVWLCPTSVFCSLPLHAMGPIPSSDTYQRYFSDLYIPSYTPSLSALIESRKASSQVLGKPSLLLVAQPEDFLPGVKEEIKVLVRNLKDRATVTALVSRKATPTSVVEGLRGSRLAHFACHGVLETGKPFEASFTLHGGLRLTLLDIVQSRLPDAEFAFLSCCHAAEVTEDSIADEALHLTAAMQYCGFRSVVGTMWEMADTDGRDLAKSFYKSLLSESDEGAGVLFHERSAGALRDAIQKLREKRGVTMERWVNFVHYGA